MAKVGKARLVLPDGFFDALEQKLTPQLRETADAVAAGIDGETLVRMQPNDSGRLTAIVYLAEPGGAAKQAKHGVLTRAAAAQGLVVRRYQQR